MIFKYLTSIVKPCVFKLFSLRKITKSNFYHHLPTLNIANLFMQSFASHPTPHTNPPTKITHHIKRAQLSLIPTPFPPKKTTERAQLSPIPTPFPPKNNKKGATIAYTYALSTKKSIERAQLSLVLAKNITIFAKKQINHNYYDKQRINRKSL